MKDHINHDLFGKFKPLRSMTHKCLLSAIGTIQSTLNDFHGVVKSVTTAYYYVPKAKICLFKKLDN